MRTGQAEPADLWGLVLGRPELDPDDLARQVTAQASQHPLDYRTRQLIAECLHALEGYWGTQRFGEWLRASPQREVLRQLRSASFDRTGFPSLPRRLMPATRPEHIEQYLRELGLGVRPTVTVTIGGSASLILGGYLSRHTEDVDLVDEVPAEVRQLYGELEAMEQRYGLRLAHFQSHYLPAGWEERVHSRGDFGRLRVFLVDVYDVFVGKLFSRREKDRDDLRVLAPQLDKELLTRRLRDGADALLGDAALAANARANWYVLFGEDLPHDPDTATGQG